MERASIIGLIVAAATVLFVFFEKKVVTRPSGLAESGQRQAEQLPISVSRGTPVLDGKADDAIWQSGTWLPMEQVWLGAPPAVEDFSGKYQLAWDENFLYLVAEIQDDILLDTHTDGLEKYWDDDCLEIFIDEDASGGNHQYNHNAFAYHIALDGKVTDIDTRGNFAYFNDHCTTVRKTKGNKSVWEVAIRIFDGNKYVDGGENFPKLLKSGKIMGFAVAYCDNDASPERENFVGNVHIAGDDKNRGWVDASVFGKLILK